MKRPGSPHPGSLAHARVLLARSELPEALAILEQRRQLAEANNWRDELLRVVILQALAIKGDRALRLLDEALAMVEEE